MTNQEINTEFLGAVNEQTKQIILKNIAEHYGISTEEAYNEVVGENAECFLEYMTEPERSSAAVFRRNFMFLISNRS